MEAVIPPPDCELFGGPLDGDRLYAEHVAIISIPFNGARIIYEYTGETSADGQLWRYQYQPQPKGEAA